MKILMLTPYVTIESRPEFSRNKTGFGYMVLDIAKAVGKTEQVDVLASDSRGDSFDFESVHFLERSFLKMILNLRRCLSPLALFKLWRQYHMKGGTLLRLIYYWLLTGYLNSVIKKGNYDLVHIHGCGFASELWMQVCHQVGQKFVVTLHGLNSFSDSVRLESAGKQYERDFLKRVVEEEISITVISTGMKRLIEKTYSVEKCKNVTVVCNSYSFDDTSKGEIDVRQMYDIPKDAKVLLYVGNISQNKNQKQMINAFGLLPIELQKSTYVLFCGRPNAACGLEGLIAMQNYSNHLILCGAVNKQQMVDYYKCADGVALLSYAEGFGLSLVEGMRFGLPSMMFSDMDAFEDIYDKCAVVAVDNRNNSVVAKNMEVLLSNDWNKEAIKSSSKRFQSDTMASNYIQVYKDMICK